MKMDSTGQTALNEALDRMWIQFLPQIAERVTILESAVAAVVAGRLSAEQREAAHAAAHKLAGVLGTFGLTRGTELARELEIFYSSENGAETTLRQRLISIAAELRAVVESRK
jgi:HPt (histidine-containing phosphotransfer) domain-containing protein